MKRHKWNNEFWKNNGHATCIDCGTVKEKHFPVIFYFVPYDKITTGNKAPDCQNVIDRIKQSQLNMKTALRKFDFWCDCIVYHYPKEYICFRVCPVCDKRMTKRK